MNLLVRPETGGNTIECFGFEHLAFSARRLGPGEAFEGDTAGRELAVVALGGVFSANSSAGSWRSIGGRADVFSGLPHALYLPISTPFRLTAITACDLAFCYALAERVFPARVIAPEDTEIEIRGGGNQ